MVVAPASPAPTERVRRFNLSPILSLNISWPEPTFSPVTSKLFAVVPTIIVSLSEVTDINVPPRIFFKLTVFSTFSLKTP